jgi:predicted MFS family arabinose efflux permease
LSVAAGAWTLIGLTALFGVGHGAARAGVDAHVQRGVDSSLRGSASALQYSAFDLVIGMGGWALGVLAGATSYGVMYAAVSGIVLMSVFLCGPLRRCDAVLRS